MYLFTIQNLCIYKSGIFKVNWKKILKTTLLTLFCASTINALMIQSSLAESGTGYSNDEIININVYEKASPCVVSILADIKDGASSGSGIIIDPAGIILTSSHVVGKAKQINVAMASGKRYSGEIIAITGKNDDLALIKITPPYKLPFAQLGDSTRIRVGQKVLAIGNPFGFERTLTTGIVSRIDYDRQRIQTDAAINPGSSGGPLLNSTGEVIGINQSIYNPDNNRSNIGISFAVPVNAAKRFIKEISGGIHPNNDNKNAQIFSKDYKPVGDTQY
jgi:serine protease Do